MNKKVAIGIFAAAALLAVLALSVVATDWGNFVSNDSPQSIDFVGTVDDDGKPIMDADGNYTSLNFALFEQYGPLMLILALLMFGAMIGGVCVAREEGEHNDTD